MAATGPRRSLGGIITMDMTTELSFPKLVAVTTGALLRTTHDGLGRGSHPIIERHGDVFHAEELKRLILFGVANCGWFLHDLSCDKKALACLTGGNALHGDGRIREDGKTKKPGAT